MKRPFSVAAGTKREAILEKFGEPTARGWQDSILGYLRCVVFNGDVWSLFFLVPIPEWGDKDRITDCEYLGFWFDRSGVMMKGDIHVVHSLWIEPANASAVREYYEGDLRNWLGKNAPWAR